MSDRIFRRANLKSEFSMVHREIERLVKKYKDDYDKQAQLLYRKHNYIWNDEEKELYDHLEDVIPLFDDIAVSTNIERLKNSIKSSLPKKVKLFDVNSVNVPTAEQLYLLHASDYENQSTNELSKLVDFYVDQIRIALDTEFTKWKNELL